MLTKTQEEFLSLIRFEICGTALPKDFSVSDENALIALAKKQDLTHLIYDALIKNDLPCSSSFAMQQYYASIWRVEQMQHEIARLSELFEEEKIDFILLKGSVMRRFYPENWMRTSADIDILFRESEFERVKKLVIEKLGYKGEDGNGGTCHYSVFAPGSEVHVELHRQLFTEYLAKPRVFETMSRVWTMVEKTDDSSCQYTMPDALLYFYHLAHMAKHITYSGGCAVRGLIDLWLLDNIPDKDEAGRKQLLEENDLAVFGNHMSALADAWMNGRPAPSEELEQYILADYMYGNEGRRLANAVSKNGSAKVVLQKIFMPYDKIKNLYPVLKKHRYLTPVFEVVRWTGVFNKERRERLKNGVSTLSRTDEGAVNTANSISKLLQLGDQ